MVIPYTERVFHSSANNLWWCSSIFSCERSSWGNNNSVRNIRTVSLTLIVPLLRGVDEKKLYNKYYNTEPQKSSIKLRKYKKYSWIIRNLSLMQNNRHNLRKYLIKIDIITVGNCAGINLLHTALYFCRFHWPELL